MSHKRAPFYFGNNKMLTTIAFSAIEQLRCGDTFQFFTSFCSSSENAAVKELLIMVNVWSSYCENKKGTPFMARIVYSIT